MGVSETREALPDSDTGRHGSWNTRSEHADRGRRQDHGHLLEKHIKSLRTWGFFQGLGCHSMAKPLTGSEAMSLRFDQILLMCLILPFIALGNGANLPMVQPKQNVWEALANAAGLDSVCLTDSRPGRPFSTCLVGLPVNEWPIPKNTPTKISWVISNPVNEWCLWTQFLPVTPFEPEELEILGSTKMNFCIKFELLEVTQTKNKTIYVTPNHPFYRNASVWCKCTKVTTKASFQVPAQLPQGIFFICGDRI